MEKKEIERLRRETSLLRSAMTEQGTRLAEMISQVARVTKRQDDLDAADCELKEMMLEFGKQMDTISKMVDTILQTLAGRLADENT